MYEYLDKYCERIHPQWWSEPLNIASNLAFIVVAVLLLRLYLTNHKLNREHKNQACCWDIKILILLIFIIGIGSALWHITALYWALLTDQIPILLFINLFLLSCLYRVFQVTPLKILAIFLLYQAVNTGLQLTLPAQFLNGSIFYLPTLIFLMLITVASYTSRPDHAKTFLISTILFFIALVFRTLDLEICADLTIGSHFIWHILIAMTIFYLMHLLLDSLTTPQRTKPILIRQKK